MTEKPEASISALLMIHTIFLLTIGILLMVWDYRGQLPYLRSSLQNYVSIPIKTLSDWPTDLKNNISVFFVQQSALRTENEKLKKKVLWLKANLANQTVLEAEHRRLEQLLQSTVAETRPVMIAQVVDSYISASKQQIEVNKGRINNVFEGQVVIDANGVVGQVTKVYDKLSIVSLISDEAQRIPVFIERNRLRMILQGAGDLGDLTVNFVGKKADVRIGDKLVTSGLGGRYSRGYGVATITSVTRSPTDEFYDIHAEPLAALDKVLEVLMISKQAVEKTSN